MRRLASQERHGRCAYEPSRRGFGAMRSEDLATWVDVSGRVSSPPEHKHGTALRLPGSVGGGVRGRPRATARRLRAFVGRGMSGRDDRRRMLVR